ncbi:MAG: DUF3499 domain-containing protein [Actinomycetaceae bacterium]|nr:DUF3499 domain-containing protein [Actinomycetaceae bacterium]
MSHARKCSRTTCYAPAVATLTYQYNDATAVLGPLSPLADRSAFDFCQHHANTLTVPRGWTMIRLADNFEPPARATEDDVIDFVNKAAAGKNEKKLSPQEEAEMSRARRAHPSTLTPRPHLSLVS